MMSALVICIVVLIGIRIYLQPSFIPNVKQTLSVGTATDIGGLEIQADAYEVIEGTPGVLALLADGFGKGNRGKIASHVAVQTCLGLYKNYKKLVNPQYFFKRAFNLANFEVLKLLDEDNGGTSLLVAFIAEDTLFYALAGDIKIAVLRSGDLVPLSEGHTLNKLAQNAYKTGKLTKQKTLWTLKEERLWNYIGQDAFKEIELYDIPVQLKKDDLIILMTKGVYQNVNLCTLEMILKEQGINVQEMADKVIQNVQTAPEQHRENATIMVIKVNDIKGR